MAESVTSPFGFAIEYVLQNEGGYSNHADDTGGETKWGITKRAAFDYGFDFNELTLAQARAIYRDQYWMFDGLRDRRLAAKCLDVVVNFGRAGGTRVLQRACGADVDGIYGEETERKLTNAATDDMLEKIAIAAADRYVGICIDKPTQLVFLRGWIRRAVKQPPRRIVEPPVET